MSLRHFLRSAYLIGVYFTLTIAPLFVMLTDPTPPGRGFWRECSIGLGFVGLSMMGLQFFLTGRFQRLTSPYGIDVVYHFHRNISLIAFLFIFLHAVILFISSPETLILLNPVISPWWMIVGVAGLLAFAIVIVTSLYRLKFGLCYEHWRLIHGYISVVAVALSVAHIIGVGYYVEGYLKRGLWITMITAWLLALVYVRVMKPIIMLRRPYTIEKVKRERGNSWTLTLRPEGHKGMNFRPGQFAWLTIGKSPFSIREHPFSFSSSAMKTDSMQVTVKELGDFTSRIGEVAPGTRTYIEGPYGTFTVDRHVAPGYIFITGGVGITPVISILRTMADRNDRRPVLLFYSNKTWEGMTFREDLDELEKQLNLRVVYIITGDAPEGWQGERGRINAEMIARHLPADRMRYKYFICGPDPMQKAIKNELGNLGLSLENVESESFNFV
ncbi:MAG: ferric reductase-like transmembrane domain-containing protein [Nitrospirae bacterium]|jgi:predicted ferric reductase|nr:ferric reductase-like transmembrane domain-containing protein [Nitrospirota bacterium]